jgi:hypothetical protein
MKVPQRFPSCYLRTKNMAKLTGAFLQVLVANEPKRGGTFILPVGLIPVFKRSEFGTYVCYSAKYRNVETTVSWEDTVM